MFIQSLIPLIKDKNLELTRVISLIRHGWLDNQSIVDTTQKLILDPFRTVCADWRARIKYSLKDSDNISY